MHQFNALEFKGVGGPPAKSWDTCPGHMTACDASGDAIGCLSFSNDATLLLPQAALTGTYRVTGVRGWSHPQPDGTIAHVNGAYFAVTATRDGTHVKVNARGTILAGGGIAKVSPGGMLDLALDAGDVAELVGPADVAEDLSGSLVTADAPIQIVAGAPCIEAPIGTDSCDHVESAVFPAETWGKDYFVAVPTSANGEPSVTSCASTETATGRSSTTRRRNPKARPTPSTQARSSISASSRRTSASPATGARGRFLHAGRRRRRHRDPRARRSVDVVLASTAQFRGEYVFLAPNDYDASYADVIAEADAYIELDDHPLIDPATDPGHCATSSIARSSIAITRRAQARRRQAGRPRDRRIRRVHELSHARRARSARHRGAAPALIFA